MGKYKNTGWEFWCDIKTVIGNATIINGKKPYTGIKFNFGFSRLIEYVGEDMIIIGKKYNPEYTEKDLRQDLKEINKAMKAFGGN